MKLITPDTLAECPHFKRLFLESLSTMHKQSLMDALDRRDLSVFWELFEPIVGIEVHIGLHSASKLFSGAPLGTAGWLDVGYPGAMPMLDATAVQSALSIGASLGAQIPSQMFFERKRYAYPDLSKGYQTTQKTAPVFTGGAITCSFGTLDITRAQLEEDAASVGRTYAGFIMDFTRAGSALLEVVTEPRVMTPDMLIEALKTLYLQAQMIGATEGKIEAGQFKADINLSIRPKGSSYYTERWEIKGIGSFEFAKAAFTDALLSRFAALLDTTLSVSERLGEAQTLGFDEVHGKCFVMRQKLADHQYRFLPCPDLSEEPLTTPTICTLPLHTVKSLTAYAVFDALEPKATPETQIDAATPDAKASVHPNCLHESPAYEHLLASQKWRQALEVPQVLRFLSLWPQALWPKVPQTLLSTPPQLHPIHIPMSRELIDLDVRTRAVTLITVTSLQDAPEAPGFTPICYADVAPSDFESVLWLCCSHLQSFEDTDLLALWFAAITALNFSGTKEPATISPLEALRVALPFTSRQQTGAVLGPSLLGLFIAPDPMRLTQLIEAFTSKVRQALQEAKEAKAQSQTHLLALRAPFIALLTNDVKFQSACQETLSGKPKAKGYIQGKMQQTVRILGLAISGAQMSDWIDSMLTEHREQIFLATP